MDEIEDMPKDFEQNHQDTPPGSSVESGTEQDDAQKPVNPSEDEENTKGRVEYSSTRGDVLFTFGPNRSYFLYANPRWVSYVASSDRHTCFQPNILTPVQQWEYGCVQFFARENCSAIRCLLNPRRRPVLSL